LEIYSLGSFVILIFVEYNTKSKKKNHLMAVINRLKSVLAEKQCRLAKKNIDKYRQGELSTTEGLY